MTVTRMCRSMRLSVVRQGTQRGHRTNHFLNGRNRGLRNLGLGIMEIQLRSSPCGAEIVNASIRFFMQRVMALASPSKGLIILEVSSGAPDPVSYRLPTLRRRFHPNRVIRVTSTQVTHACRDCNSGCAHLDRIGFLVNAWVGAREKMSGLRGSPLGFARRRVVLGVGWCVKAGIVPLP